jgi:hypothetical protein
MSSATTLAVTRAPARHPGAAGVEPGDGRITACLRQNAAKLSPACQRAMSAAQTARQPSESGS